MKKNLLLIAIILCTYAGRAQELLTLKNAIEIALQNNYDIKLVKNDLSIAQNNQNWGNSGMLPTVNGNFSTSKSQQNTQQTQASGVQRITKDAKSTDLSYGVGLDWTIFDGFKMFANYDRLKALEKQGQINYKGQIMLSVANVISAYYNVAKQQLLVKTADSSIQISKLRLNIAQSKFKIGKGSKLDVVAAKVDYNTDSSAYLQQVNLLNSNKIVLNEILARDVNTAFTANETIDIQGDLDYKTLNEKTTELNPDLQNAILNKRIAELNFKQIVANRYPRVSLNSGYNFNKSTSPTGFNTQFMASGFNYGLTATLNIFNGFLQRQNERNAKLAINSSNLSMDKTHQAVQAQLATAFQNYTTSLALVKMENNNVNLAKENLDITLAKYRLGNITPLELRTAQLNENDAQSRFLEAQYQTKLAEITLKQISGTIDIQ